MYYATAIGAFSLFTLLQAGRKFEAVEASMISKYLGDMKQEELNKFNIEEYLQAQRQLDLTDKTDLKEKWGGQQLIMQEAPAFDPSSTYQPLPSEPNTHSNQEM